MQSENRFFDDLAKLVNGAAGTVAGMSREFESNARERAKQWIGGMDFVSRDEFDAVKALAAAAREEVESLKARLDALEGKASEPVQQPVRAKPKDAEYAAGFGRKRRCPRIFHAAPVSTGAKNALRRADDGQRRI